MKNKPFSRRSFIGGVAAMPAVAATRVPVVVPPVLLSNVQVSQEPLEILTTFPFEPHEIRKIEAAGGNVKVTLTVYKSIAELREKAKNAEVIYGDVDAATLAAAPNLKWNQAREAGMEHMDPALRASNVVVTNYQRTFAPAITETGMGLLICLTRGIVRDYIPQFYKRQMKPVGTNKSPDHIELAGRTMGIVGMGGIGSTMARRAHYGFDMRVVATDAKPLPKPEYVAELHDPGWFPEMAKQVDVLVTAAPDTPLTERMVNEQIFRSMKPTAFFIALSRGKLYDDMALVRALKEGWIKGAGLDVFPIEPPPSDHPIFDCKNVVMTAHTSGWSPDRQIRLIDDFAENVRRYTHGLPLTKVVDKKAGY